MRDRPRSWRVRVFPKRSLLRAGTLAFVLISVPLFGSLYFLGIPLGTWPVVLAAQLLSLAIVAFAYTRFKLTFVGVTDDRLVERGFLSRIRSIPLSSITSVVLVETYRTNAPDSTPQLLLRDGTDQRLLRLRGIFWSEKSMRAIAETIERPLSHFPDPITTQEFFAKYPSGAYWFEDRPVLAVLAGVLVFVISLGAVLGLMSLSGIPITLVG